MVRKERTAVLCPAEIRKFFVGLLRAFFLQLKAGGVRQHLQLSVQLVNLFPLGEYEPAKHQNGDKKKTD
jgi:hypothetical protein